MKKIGIIGFGNMGSAIISALMENEGDYSFAIADKDEQKLAQMALTGQQCLVSTDINQIIENSEIIIIAVKPQTFEEMAGEIIVPVEGKIFISIMAGVNVKKISETLKTDKIVRTMPNLPAMVSAGITGVYFTEAISEMEKEVINQILHAFSLVVEVEEESGLNKITALSGSGPAYFFYLTQLLQEKAEEFGFSPDQAALIAEGTFVGSATAFSEGEKNAKEWVSAVASKGGTTEAALNHFNAHHFDKIFKSALDMAEQRAKELSE